MISARKYKIITIVQILLVIGVLGGGAYFAYNKLNTKEEVNTGDIIEEDVVVPDIQELDEDIIVADVNENVVHDGFDVTIRIPKITNELGNSINEKIKSDLEEYYENKDHSIDFNYYINNEIISLVIDIKDQNEEVNYLTYNFNMNDYILLDNHELLKIKEIKEEDVHGLLINIYEAHLKDNLKEDKKDIDRTSISYKKTIDKDNCTLDGAMFLDQDNHLNYVFTEYQDDVMVKYLYNLNAKKVVER